MKGIIFQEIKNTIFRSKVVFILSVLAFTCACVGINASLTGLVANSREKAAAEASFGDRHTYRIFMDGDSDTYMRVFANSNTGNVKKLFDALAGDPHFEYRYTAENMMDFFDPETNGRDIMQEVAFRDEFRTGYETGTASCEEGYLSLKAVYADRNFCTDTGVKIASGRAFETEVFTVASTDEITVPVILGNGYKDLYDLGDRIPYAHLGTVQPVTLVVAGFLEKGSYFYDNNAIKIMLDRYMIVPAVQTSYDGRNPDGSYDEFTHAAYDTMKIIGSRIVCDESSAEEVRAEAEKIFRENGFSELRLEEESEGFAEYLASSKESAALSLVITAATIIMISLMICIQTFYRIMKNRKKYCILMLNGITRMKMMLIIMSGTIPVFACSVILFFLMKLLNPQDSPFDLGISEYSFATVAAVMFTIPVFVGIFGEAKICRIDMSAVLREHE